MARYRLIVLAVLLVGALFLLHDQYAGTETEGVDGYPSHTPSSGTNGRYQYVLGPPTAKYRDNLRNDTKYITSWPENGMTNTVMAYANLIYLGIVTKRVVIIPPFAPAHIGRSEPSLNFGDVFDVPALSAKLNLPIIEWRDVKQDVPEEHEEFEDLGCWSTWAITHGRIIYVGMEDRLGLDVAYTPVPERARIKEEFDHAVNAHALAALHFPITREQAILDPPEPASKNRRHGLELPPDDHLLCFDFLFNMGTVLHYEWNFEWAPAWVDVGQYLKFNSRVTDLTTAAVRRAFSIAPSNPLPPFIAVHVRHGDFLDTCDDKIKGEGCIAPLDAYANRVREVQDELRDRHGVEVKHVLMTSDERDPVWWDEVGALGWSWINFSEEAPDEILQRWYPIVIDSIAQSMAAGFVGTSRSTVSLLSIRRVQAWNDGPIRWVNWGWPDADKGVTLNQTANIAAS